MNGFLGLVQLALLFGFAGALAAALAGLLARPFASRYLESVAPSERSRLLLLWSLAPVLAALATVLLALLPSLLQWLGLHTDHCLGHSDGHVHFCLVHRPAPLSHWLQVLPGALFFFLLAAITLRAILHARETGRLARSLRSHPHDRDGDVNILHSETPLALSCGFLRPRIWISTALLDALTPAEHAMLLAHERAHAQRRDACRLLLARAFSLAHFPPLRRYLLEQMDLACEQACDEVSSRTAGDPGKVARLLLKIERLYHRHFPAVPTLGAHVLGKAGSSVPARIQSLLLEPRWRARSGLSPWLLLVLSAVLLVGHDIPHDLLEHLVASLALF